MYIEICALQKEKGYEKTVEENRSYVNGSGHGDSFGRVCQNG